MVSPEVEVESSPLKNKTPVTAPRNARKSSSHNHAKNPPLSADSTQCCQVRYRPEPIPIRD